MIDMLNIVEVILAIILIFVVLVQQKNVTLNLTSMGGGMGAVTKRGPEKVLHNLTILLGSLFILNSLVLFWIS